MPFPIDNHTIEAIQKHFKRKNFEYTENYFLSILDNKQSTKYDIYWAVLGLTGVGTKKSIKPLKDIRSYSMEDIKNRSILTIAHIAGKDETLYYVECLSDKKMKKDYPMWAIYDTADEKAIDGVLEYLTKVYKKWKQPQCNYAGDAYLEGLLYLERFSKIDKRIIELFSLYKNIISKMPSGARDTISEQTIVLKKILFSNLEM